MAIEPGYLDQLRARVSIAEAIGKRLDWDVRKSNPARGDYWACCPFHGEKTPSFHVEDRKGFFYCFGCHEKGDVIGFVMRNDNLRFDEAVDLLAREAGMQPPVRDARAREKQEKRKGLSEAMEAAQRFYRAQLGGAAARDARAYLERRELDAATIGEFGIGYAPGGNALGETLRGQGFTPAILAEAGLVGSNESGSTYDIFRERILFPIRDQRGGVIAFGGRAMREDARAKYLNSPETPLFSKRGTLYNFGPARAAAGKGQRMIVAEGYMDVIALHRAGLAAAVAPLGTALTADQLSLLWRAVDEPVIALDGDAAGLRAAARTAELALPLLQPGKTLLFALMPEGKDPDDLIREKGRTGIDSVIESAEPLSRFLWRCEIEKQSLDTPERRAAFDNRVRTMLGGITDQGVRHHYETQFREWRHDLFSTTRDAWKPQNPGGRKGWSKVAPPAPARTETRHSALVTGGGPDLRYALEQQILRLALASPEAMAACGDSLAESEFANRDLDSIRSALISAFFDIASPETGMTVSKLHAETRRRLKPDCTALFERLADFTGDSSDSDHLTSALDRHIAICAREVEKRDAEHSFSRDGDERAFQRMVAARAAHRTALERVMPVVSEAESGSVQGFIDGELWKKRKKKTDRRNGGTRRDDGAGEMTRE